MYAVDEPSVDVVAAYPGKTAAFYAYEWTLPAAVRIAGVYLRSYWPVMLAPKGPG